MTMTERQLIERFLELQEHPEKVTDEQIEQALANPQMRELVEQMSFTKRALRNRHNDKEPQVDEEWEKFTTRFSLNDSSTAKPHSPLARLFSLFRKKAAIFIGILFLSGIAFAAIHFARHHVGEDLKSTTQEIQISNPHQQTVSKDTVEKATAAPPDTITITHPIVFDNVRLDEILPQIASYYQMEVEFNNEHARQFRFYFIWKHEDGLDHTMEKLNRFESLSIKIEDNKIIVE